MSNNYLEFDIVAEISQSRPATDRLWFACMHGIPAKNQGTFEVWGWVPCCDINPSYGPSSAGSSLAIITLFISLFQREATPTKSRLPLCPSLPRWCSYDSPSFHPPLCMTVEESDPIGETPETFTSLQNSSPFSPALRPAIPLPIYWRAPGTSQTKDARSRHGVLAATGFLTFRRRPPSRWLRTNDGAISGKQPARVGAE